MRDYLTEIFKDFKSNEDINNKDLSNGIKVKFTMTP